MNCLRGHIAERMCGGRAVAVVLAVAFCLLSFTWAGQAQVFKWVDENGTIHFSNTPPEQRPPGDVEVRRMRDRRPMVSGQAIEGATAIEEASDRRERRRPKRGEFIKFFSAKWCGVCRRARLFLDNEGVPYVEYDIDAEPWAAERIRELTGSGGVPVAVIGGRVLRGFSSVSYSRAIDAWLGS